ncbi:MAG: helix-turn-helix transcriptional regulator [Bacteroidetes bacterium]|uniref:Helix-turn-helix transcriptional regulator n=1 Tax=Candidatus Limisoma faecipullorum TaxID=2840854 RepID=A0A9D9ISQ6_9BACT|nr:helix-turn-helix transcriptional regulator [Candidatus Limisoma faecipullorum]
MALVTPETKLCDVILDEPSAITVINRFGISLGVGDKNVRTICAQKGIDINFFLTILNAYIYESFFPENGFDSFGAQEIIEYLEKTNQSYLKYQLPNIERHFKALIGHSDKNNNLPLLLNLYKEVKEEIIKRIDNDNKHWFAEILRHEKDVAPGQLTIEASDTQRTADSIEDKLSDLKNMFVIHLRGDYDRNLCQAVLFAIINFEKDIRQNNRIRNHILYPLAVALKKASSTNN